MKENNILKVPFWKVALRFTLSFLVLLTIFLAGVEFFKAENYRAFADIIDASITSGAWVNFVLSKIAIAIVYGVAMAYFSIKKAKKLQGIK